MAVLQFVTFVAQYIYLASLIQASYKGCKKWKLVILSPQYSTLNVD